MDENISAAEATPDLGFSSEGLVDNFFNPPAEQQTQTPVEDTQPAPQAAQSQVVDDGIDYKAKYESFYSHLDRTGIGEELLEPSFDLLDGLLATTDDGGMTTAPFWERLEGLSQPRFERLLTDASEKYSDRILSAFDEAKLYERLGLNPALRDVYSQVSPSGGLNGSMIGGYDPAIVESIDAELRDVYKSLPYEKQLRLDELSPADRNDELRDKFALQQLQNQQKEATRLANEEKARAAEEVKDTRLHSFIKQQEDGFYQSLQQSFNPFGNDAEKAPITERLHRAIYADVTHALNEDQQGQALLKSLATAVRDGDKVGESRLLSRINVMVAKHRNSAIEQWNSIIGAGLQAQQTQRQNAAKTIAVNGSGGFSADRGVQGLVNNDDLNDPQNILAMAESLGLNYR